MNRHDFPEFLCDYHLALCDAIPHTCVQLRNLVLSAFPRHMMLPDPFTPNLKVDLLPESSQPPTVLSPYTAALSAAGIRDFNSILDQIAEKSPLRRNVTAEEVGDACLFLAGPHSRGITGTTLHVDGGYHMMGV